MSTGDWFTLQPLNFVSKQELDTDLNDIPSRLTSLESDVLFIFDTLDQALTSITDINLRLINITNRVGTLEGNVNSLSDTVNKIEQDSTFINTQLQQLQGLPNQVNNLQTSVDNLNNIINDHAK
jgi:DNA repair ATPase RecN